MWSTFISPEYVIKSSYVELTQGCRSHTPYNFNFVNLVTIFINKCPYALLYNSHTYMLSHIPAHVVPSVYHDSPPTA